MGVEMGNHNEMEVEMNEQTQPQYSLRTPYH